MTARDELRSAVAAEFQRLDAHECGYDHGFCADPDADPETAAFVDAAIRVVLHEVTAQLGAGMFWFDARDRTSAMATVLGMADASTPTSKEQQR